MSDYSEAVLVEGECPVGYVDLEVFVAPPLPAGSSPAADEAAHAKGVASAVEEFLLAVGGRPQRRNFVDLRSRVVSAASYAKASPT
jgi:hypothetical protein